MTPTAFGTHICGANAVPPAFGTHICGANA